MTAVYLELGTKRVFAAAFDWPGWCRAAKTEDQALEALAAYRSRYRPVVSLAGLPAPGSDFEVAERVAGSKTTDFGAPAAVPAPDADPLSAEQAGRLVALVQACWTFLDQVASATPAALRTGPRGGGRDRDHMLQHVLGAEAAYAGKIGIRLKEPRVGDTAPIGEARAAILAVLGAASQGGPLRDGGWPARYAARRIAWHVLDHAWEMQDRTG